MVLNASGAAHVSQTLERNPDRESIQCFIINDAILCDFTPPASLEWSGDVIPAPRDPNKHATKLGAWQTFGKYLASDAVLALTVPPPPRFARFRQRFVPSRTATAVPSYLLHRVVVVVLLPATLSAVASPIHHEIFIFKSVESAERGHCVLVGPFIKLLKSRRRIWARTASEGCLEQTCTLAEFAANFITIVAGGSFEVTLRNSTKQQLPGNNENK